MNANNIPRTENHTLISGEERVQIERLKRKVRALEAELAQHRHLQEAASKLAAIIESSEDAIASKDLNGIISSWNASAERMFGYKAEEIIGKSVTTIIPPELHKDEDMILSRIRRGERIEHFETVRVTKSGKRIDVSLTISPVKDESGRIIGAAKIARDISQRKRAEEALRSAEKMAATGQLAAIIAQEINNPMQALTNVLELLAQTPALEDHSRRLVSLADKQLSRMAHITRQMLSFYRGDGRPVAVSIMDVLDDVLELFVSKISSNNISVERRYECNASVCGFPVELRQLFANLIANAIEAVGHNGRIYVHVCWARERVAPNRRGVRIIIADNGPGIRPELRKQIFQPFFTTKADRGTGLGLWVSKGIVSKHEGSIRLRSTTRQGRSGTAFSIFIPVPNSADTTARDSVPDVGFAAA